MNKKIFAIAILGCLLLTTVAGLSATGLNVENKNDRNKYPTYNPTPEMWSKTFGTEDLVEQGQDVEITNDGGYIIIGDGDHGYESLDDIWLLKLDSKGNKIWDKKIGTDEEEYGHSIEVASDGGFLIAGSIWSKNNDSRVYAWLIKTDSNGDIEWEKIFGPMFWTNIHQPWYKDFYVENTDDGGCVIYGLKDDRAWMAKVDFQGDVVFDKTYDASYFEIAHSVKQTDDNGFIMVGYTSRGSGANTVSQIVLKKLDSNGEVVFNKIFEPLTEYEYDRGYCIETANDGGYVIIGESLTYSDYTYIIFKTDSDGNIEWKKNLGLFAEIETYGDGSIQKTSDGGFIVTGIILSIGGNPSDLWIAKYKINGELDWQKRYDDGKREVDCGNSIKQTNDGGYIITGYTVIWRTHYPLITYSDIWVIKTDSKGNIKSRTRNMNQFLQNIL